VSRSFEINILHGEAFRPRDLGFEFGARRKGPSLIRLENMGARNYRFRPIVGREDCFATPEWMSLDEARAWLDAYCVEQGEYGDMVRHRA